MSAIVSRRSLTPAEIRQLRVAQMVGDPWIPVDKLEITRRVIQYATMMAQREGLIPEDASGYFARFNPATSTVFLSPDAPDGILDARSSDHVRPAGGVIEIMIPARLLPSAMPQLASPMVEQ